MPPRRGAPTHEDPLPPLLLCILCAGPAAAQDGQRARVEALPRSPNIVVIIGDDHGWPYAGFMGDPIVETPNLDTLAAEGTVFTHVFASSPVCRPSLQTLMSGLDANRWQVQKEYLRETRGRSFRCCDEVYDYQTLPRQLSRRGYNTFQAGKHWEETFWAAGFDAGSAKLPFRVRDDGARFVRESIDSLLAFLDGVDDEDPFLLWLAPMLPHVPLDPPPEFRARYEGRGLAPEAVLYYGNVTRLDDAVGRIVRLLERRGLREDTLIVYVSDNGWQQDPYERHFLGSWIGGAKGKKSIYEMGFRAPTIFHWPGRVPAGERVDDLASFEDLNATFLDYGGVPIPPDHDGFSLRERIEGEGEPARERVFGRFRGLRVRESEYVPGQWIDTDEVGAYVRSRSWRLVSYRSRGEVELYRIDEDPTEDHDVAEQYPAVVARLSAELDAWLDGLDAPALWMDLAGEVRVLFGPPRPGARLILEGTTVDGATVERMVSTAENGSFRFPNVPTGSYTIRPEAGSFIYDSQIVEAAKVDLTGAITAPRLLFAVFGEPLPQHPLGRSEIAGRVERRGRPVAGVPVELHGWTRDGPFSARVATGPDGGFVLDRIPSGLHLQWLRPLEGLRAPIVPVLLPPDSRAETAVELRRWPRRWNRRAGR